MLLICPTDSAPYVLRCRWLLFDDVRGPSSQVPNPNSKAPTNPSSYVPANPSSEVQAHKSQPSAQRSQLTNPGSQVPAQSVQLTGPNAKHPARPNLQAPCHGPQLRIFTTQRILAQMPKLTDPSSYQLTGSNLRGPSPEIPESNLCGAGARPFRTEAVRRIL